LTASAMPSDFKDLLQCATLPWSFTLIAGPNIYTFLGDKGKNKGLKDTL
jgi:hypothetical protein